MRYYNINNHSDKTIEKVRSMFKERFLAYVEAVMDEKVDEMIEDLREARFTSKDDFTLDWRFRVAADVVLGVIREAERVEK